MANEFKHGSVGTDLSQAEWEGIGTHVLDSQATGDVIYASSATQLSRLAKGTDGQVLTLASGIPSWANTAIKADDIATGDGAVNLETTSGNITIDAQATDADVIIKVDDNGSPVTAVTFDGSAEGDAIFVNDIELKSDSSVLKFGTDLDTTLTHTNDVGLTLNSDNKLMFGDSASFVHQSADGTLAIDGEAIIDLNASTRVDVSADLKVGGEVQTGSIGYTDGDNSMTIADGGKVTFSAGFAVGSDASGDILYSNGTNYIRLAKGSDGQFLSLSSGIPSWATVSTAGGGGNSKDFVASGAISNGQAVSLTSDGKVTATASATGDIVTFESGAINYLTSAYDTGNDKVLLCYTDTPNSSYATMVVGTVSGMAITFGTPVVVQSGASHYPSMTYEPDSGKAVVIYADTTGKSKVGTVSGTSISFGSEASFESGNINYTKIVTDTDANKVVAIYSDANDSYKGKCAVGTISGTSISYGTPVEFDSGNIQWVNNGVFDSNSNKVVVVYRAYAESHQMKSIVGTVSGTSISFGTAVTCGSTSGSPSGVAFDSNLNKVVIAYADEAGSSHAHAQVGTVSGTSISWGTAVEFDDTTTTDPVIAFDTSTNKCMIHYCRSVSGNTNMIVGTVSGTSISFGTTATMYAGASDYNSVVYDPDANRTIASWKDTGLGNSYGRAIVFDGSVTDSFMDWVGFAGEAISDTATGSVNLIGSVNDGQSSLTIGTTYYLAKTGALTTTITASQEVGRAVSATELLITQGRIT